MNQTTNLFFFFLFFFFFYGYFMLFILFTKSKYFFRFCVEKKKSWKEKSEEKLKERKMGEK